jgi:hypothetical protein
MSITITAARTPRTDRPRRLRAAAITLWGAITALAIAAATPHRAAIANLAHMPLTVVGFGCADYAAWHLGGGWGWLAIAISLILLEHLVADEVGDPHQRQR